MKIYRMKNNGFTLTEMAVVMIVGLFLMFIVFSVMFNALSSEVGISAKFVDELKLREASKHLAKHISSASYLNIKDRASNGEHQTSSLFLELYNYDQELIGLYGPQMGTLVFIALSGNTHTMEAKFKNVTCSFTRVRADGNKITEVKVDFTHPYDTSAIMTCKLAKGDSWAKVFGGVDYGGSTLDPLNYRIGQMERTQDGGYIIVSYSNYFNGGWPNNHEGYLLKLDRNGNKEWSRTFAPMSLYDEHLLVAEILRYEAPNLIPDGYIVAYSSTSSLSGFMLRVDELGDFQWHRHFPGYSGLEGQIRAVKQAFRLDTTGSDHLEPDGFIMAGDRGGGPQNAFLVKTDVDGNSQWVKSFSTIYSGDHSMFSSVRQTFDPSGTIPTGYIAVGRGRNGPELGGNNDVYLVKVDNHGIYEWSKFFDSEGINDSGRDIEQTRDGGYIISGVSGQKIYFIKTNSDGIHQWSKTFAGINTDSARSVAQLDIPGGGYVTAGFSRTHRINTGESCYLIKTDNNGNLSNGGGRQTGWAKVFGGEESSSSYCVRASFDKAGKLDGYALLGHTSSFDGEQPYNGYIVKTDIRGNCPEADSPERIDSPTDDITVFDMTAPTITTFNLNTPSVWIGSDDAITKYDTTDWSVGAEFSGIFPGFNNSPRIALNHIDKSMWVSTNNSNLSAPFNGAIAHFDVALNNSGLPITTFLVGTGNLNGHIPDMDIVVNPEREDNNACWFAFTESPIGNFIFKMSATGAVRGNYNDNLGTEIQISVNSRDGSCWVSDTENSRVVKLDSNGNVLFEITGHGLERPSGIAVDLNDGSCWVLDYASMTTPRGSLYKITADGDITSFPHQISQHNSGIGNIAVDQKNGFVWFANRRNNNGDVEIVLLDSNGTILDKADCGTALGFEFAPNLSNSRTGCYILDTATQEILYARYWLSNLDISTKTYLSNNPVSIALDMGDHVDTTPEGLLPDLDRSVNSAPHDPGEPI